MAEQQRPPGEILIETMKALGLSTADLSKRTGMGRARITKIRNGVGPVTREVARCLEQGTGVRAEVWLLLEKRYRRS